MKKLKISLKFDLPFDFLQSYLYPKPKEIRKDKFGIITPRRESFLYECRARQLTPDKDAIWIQSLDHLRGRRDLKLLLAFDYEKTRDIDKIKEYAAIMQADKK